MARLIWLADVLQAAGLTVVEVPGWRERGGSTFDPRGLICHATAGSPTSTDAGEIRVLLTGSTSAPPPIAQLYLSRSGTWHVVASGRCNHALTGWGGPCEGLGNSSLIGVEAQNDNRGQPWPPVQLDAYQRGVAAICRRMGWTAGRVAAHREHQPGAKTDPAGIHMTTFRQRVTALLAGDLEDEMTPAQFLEILRDPAVARQMRALPWQYVGGGVPEGMSSLGVLSGTYAAVRQLGEVIARESSNPGEVRALLAELPAPASADDIADEVLAGLGDRQPDEVARALVAAGIDAAALAAALTALTADPGQARG